MKDKKNKIKHCKDDYSQLKTKIFFQILSILVTAFITVFALYKFIWYDKAGNWIVSLFQRFFKMNYYDACNLYQQIFRNRADLIWIISIIIVFCVLFRFLLNCFTKYFNCINQGIDALLTDESEIYLPTEMASIEHKLSTVKQTLKQRSIEAQLAEQRKNELVIYLAHDIRTPLTSVIGYLNLLEEIPDLPAEQKANYIHITLDKAYHLEKMINEFFEITRYNLQQITLTKESIDLYYMLMQLTDELSPILSANGNTTRITAPENLTIYGDSEKLARVFNNVLKNAAAYSYPDTEILISAEEKLNQTVISFRNQGNTIPKEKLSAIFEKFYRLDESRASNTGGSGLGLAIAKEIITIHNGTITANSENNTITFVITLPAVH